MGKLPKWIPAAAGVVMMIVLVWLVIHRKHAETLPQEIEIQEEPRELLYGIDVGSYHLDEATLESGQTLGEILARYDITPVTVDLIAKSADSVFLLRNLRAGHKYTTFQATDSTAKLDYFVYEISTTEYLVIDFTDTNPHMHVAEKEVTVQRMQKTATITSSLWNSMIENDMSPALASELSDIYAWSIDFFGLQKDDQFTVIYDQLYVDTVCVDVGTIWGASFQHGGKTYYAIPFVQDGKLQYWDEQGNSLRKNLLKAPLKFSRISSRFSASRMHPVLRIRRPHYGVDYAAPSGTPVVAVGDGVVIFKGWGRGGGNTLKIRHNSGSLVSGYLHLRGFAKGIQQGTRVHQGQLIGYVGSTGLSTGPHLDFRLWQNGRPIDPLKVPTEPAEPIRAANKTAFEGIRDRVMAELSGPVADSLRVTTLEEISNPSRTDSTSQPRP